MTARQRKAVEFLWFKYGNGGSCHSLANHKTLQRHMEGRHEDAALYERQITGECREALDRVLRDDYSEFSESVRGIITSFGDDAETGGNG
jgi:hypothetical protein